MHSEIRGGKWLICGEKKACADGDWQEKEAVVSA
jgi:hypothetical protein